MIFKNINVLYRQLRHGTRVRLNFARNYFIIRKLRAQLKGKSPEQRLVAVMLLEHLGDIVACEPIARYVREKEPNSVIIWGVKNPYRELIDSNPHIDKTLVLHCLTENVLLKNSGLFDQVIDLHFDERYCSLCRNPPKRPNEEPRIGLHNYFNYGGLLSSMAQSNGLPSLDEAPRVYIPHDVMEKIDNLGLPSKFIAINCTSNADEKNWPRKKWEILIDKMACSFDIPVYELGLEPMISSSMPLYKSLCGTLSILESAEVIRRAKIFIGIDSGPAHLANAVGKFGVVLIGNLLGFQRYNPFSGGYSDGSNVVLLYANGPVHTISVDSVFYEVERYLVNI